MLDDAIVGANSCTLGGQGKQPLISNRFTSHFKRSAAFHRFSWNYHEQLLLCSSSVLLYHSTMITLKKSVENLNLNKNTSVSVRPDQEPNYIRH